MQPLNFRILGSCMLKGGMISLEFLQLERVFSFLTTLTDQANRGALFYVFMQSTQKLQFWRSPTAKYWG